MGEVKALWCWVVNLLQSKCFSHPFRHLGVISGDLEFPFQQKALLYLYFLLCVLKDDDIYYLKDSDQT